MWGWLQVTSGSSRALAAWTSPGFQCQMKWGDQLPHTNCPKPNAKFTFFYKKKLKAQNLRTTSMKEPSPGPKTQNLYLLLLLHPLSDCWLACMGMQRVWFHFPNCNHPADHLQARWGPPVVQGPHVKKPCPGRAIPPSLMWLKCHSRLWCLQGFNDVLSPEESPGLCPVPGKAGLSSS